MRFIEITHDSAAYQQAWELRQAVLRTPLGLRLELHERDAERGQLHFGLVDNNRRLAACASVVILSEDMARLRQMAVDPGCQGAGLGRKLIREVERILINRGIQHIEMHARESAVSFYEKLGYTVEGERFSEVTIPHVRMHRSLR